MLINNGNSHSTFNTEHTFEETKKEVKKRLDSVQMKVASKVGKDEAKQIREEIIDILQLSTDALEKRIRKNRMMWIILIIGCFLGVFCIAAVLAYPLRKYKAGIWGLWGMIAIDILVLLVNVIIEFVKAKRSGVYDETVIEGIFNTAKEFKQNLKSNGIVHLCMIVLMVVSAGGFLAKIDVFALVSEWVKGGYQAVMREQTEYEVLVQQPTVSQKVRDYLGNNDTETVKILGDIYIPNSELIYTKKLSQEDYDLIFFTDGEFRITDWENQEHINHVVLHMVEALQKENAENVFDKPDTQNGAPIEIENEISLASEKEAEVTCFKELNDILNTRTNAYESYPKASLANLISNDYHKLAIAFAWHGGNEDTIVYYYGKSIISNYEFLKYAENSRETIKDRLQRITQRYTDITYVCPEHKASEKAEKLKIAFENATNQY